jgi:ribose 5-phosphate isomerase A
VRDVTDREGLKREAALRALEEVESGMRLGLGSGSTVAHFLDVLGEKLARGGLTDVTGVPTSVGTAEHAGRLGIPLGALHRLAPLDLTVDGADEIDPSLRLIKGLGGAMLREKMVAEASSRMTVIGDDSKLVAALGQKAPLPVEVVVFAWESQVPFLEGVGAQPELRRGVDGEAYATDNGNYVLDCRFPGGIDDPAGLEEALCRRTGIVASGLFLGLATRAVVAGPGGARVLSIDAGGGA